MAEERRLCLVRAVTRPRRVECAGPAAVRARALRLRGFSDFSTCEDESLEGGERPSDIEYLKSLEPREWREHDHYKVLGLGDLRYLATEDDLKRAYRLKVLRHHPDKRRAQGENIQTEDDYFTCITKAYEILGTPLKRRSYDSVDPHFDNYVPTELTIGEDFYSTFGPYFELNSRWSEKKNVPQLGDDSYTRDQVENFYSFWYDFESWREYSYDDEEEKEKGQDREERRWIEKQNKAVRAKKKKEEMARIRSLVDSAYSNDPRVARFKQDEKEKKLALKKARQDAAQARKAEEERQLKEAQLAKEQAEKEERLRAENLKAEKELVKKQMKKERKVFRDLCKANNYYIENDSETVAHMSAVEKICEVLEMLELRDLNVKLPNDGRECFLQALNDTETKMEAERKAHLETKKDTAKTDQGQPAEWTRETIQMLVKAVNFFPAGTNQRWEVIANFINQHADISDGRKFSAKQVLAKAKDLQNSDYSKSSLKVAANREAFDKFEKDKRKPNSAVAESEISVSYDKTNGSSAQNGEVEPKKKEVEPKKKTEEKKEKEDVAWTKAEQELLEQAIKTYPASTPERWDRIADCIPNRSKKECMRRFKELVDLVKAKKMATQMSK